jgi:ribosomal subunit interface protein
MNINIKATNIELTDDIRDRVNKVLESVSKVLNVENDQFVGQVEVGKTSNHHKTGDIFRAEASLTANGQPIYVVSEKSDLYSALDDLKDEVINSIKRSRRKNRSGIRKGAAKVKDFVRKFFK